MTLRNQAHWTRDRGYREHGDARESPKCQRINGSGADLETKKPAPECWLHRLLTEPNLAGPILWTLD